MLYYIIGNPTFIFLAFTLPWLGFGLYKIDAGKLPLIILITASILLLPALTGYVYVIENFYGCLAYLIVICGYTLLLKYIARKITSTISISIILFLIGGFLAFIGAMAGTITIENQWSYKNYKIEYVRDQGFAGGPKMTYELSKYFVVPIFIKKVDSKWDNDTTTNCWVKFDDEGFNFNKCQPNKSYSIKTDVKH